MFPIYLSISTDRLWAQNWNRLKGFRTYGKAKKRIEDQQRLNSAKLKSAKLEENQKERVKGNKKGRR